MTYRGGSYLFGQYGVCALCCVACPFGGSIAPSQARQWTSYCASPFSILPTINCKPNLREGKLVWRSQCDAHHAPFLSDPQWPARHVFQAYLRACATKAGRDMPGPKDIDTAYTAFQRQHPWPRLSEHETPNDGGTTQGEPTPSAEGWTPPTILLLAPNGHKHATRTVQRHHAPWSIPKTQCTGDRCTTSQTQ